MKVYLITKDGKILSEVVSEFEKVVASTCPTRFGASAYDAESQLRLMNARTNKFVVAQAIKGGEYFAFYMPYAENHDDIYYYAEKVFQEMTGLTEGYMGRRGGGTLFPEERMICNKSVDWGKFPVGQVYEGIEQIK